MAPCTRRAQKAMKNQPKGGSNVDVISIDGTDMVNAQAGQANLTAKGNLKRTLSSLQVENNPSIHTNPASQAIAVNLTKKARIVGPVRCRPMQLKLTREGEIARQPSDVAGGSRVSKQRTLERTSSFYPGYGGVASIFDTEETNQDPDPNIDEPHTEDEEDWIYEQAEEMTALPRGQREKAMAIERLSWTGLDATAEPPPSTSTALARIDEDRDINMSPGYNGGATAKSALPTAEASANTATLLEDVQTQSPSVWPTDTEIQLVPGTNRVILTRQGILLRTVIQDAFENVRASIFFENAFPDVVLALSFIRDGLLTAAGGGPATASIYMRLLNDKDYLMKIVPLPRARISHFRAEVKERCNSITLTAFLGMSSTMEIARYVQYQLSNYNYTFPGGTIAGGLPVRRSKPYRNVRIIDIIHSSFFSGGSGSFASRFKYLFPSSETHEGVTVYEVSIPMVALVATALYATLYEWRTGEQQVMEFSANSYLDVYQGHINTLQLIQEKRGNAFRSMMAEIFSQASIMPNIGVTPGAPVAVLNMDDLEE